MLIKDKKTPRALTTLTGYRYERYGEGKETKYSVYDLEMFAVGARAPIASVPKEVKQARSVILTKRFAAQAIDKVNSKIQGGYFPPVHIGHHHQLSGQLREGCGYFTNLSFGDGSARRPNPDVVYCDVVDIPPDKFELIAQHRLPYRSVEVLAADDPDFSSLAFMETTPPYLQFKNLVVRLPKKGWELLDKDIKRVKGLAVQRFTSLQAASVCLAASSDTRIHVLSRFGRRNTVNKKMQKAAKKVKKVNLSALNDGGTPAKTAKGSNRLGRLEKVVSQLAKQVSVLVSQDTGEEDDAAPIANKAASKNTIKLSAIKSQISKSNKVLEKKLAKLEQRQLEERMLNKAERIYEMFAACKADGYDVSPDKLTQEILVDETKPLKAAKRLVATIRSQEPKFDVGSSQLDSNGDENDTITDETDPVVKRFKGEHPSVIKFAAKMADEYDQSLQFGTPSGLSRADYVRTYVLSYAENNGIQLNKDYLKGSKKESVVL